MAERQKAELPEVVKRALRRARLVKTGEAWLHYRRLLRNWSDAQKREAATND